MVQATPEIGRRVPTGIGGWLTVVALPAMLVGVAFFLSAKLGLHLSFPPDHIAVFWPPNAVVLAALLLTRPRTWWVFLAAMVLAYFPAAYQAGYSNRRAIVFLVANFSEVIVAALAVRYFLGRAPRFASSWEVTVFTLFAAGVAPLVSASVASLHEPGVAGGQAWRVWFLSDSLAHLTLTPLLLVWIAGGTGWLRALSFPRCLEAGALLIGLVVVGCFVFGGEIGAVGNLPVLVYLPLPLLLWTTVRFGPRGACLGIFLLTILSIWHASQGRGPFTAMTPAENVLTLQMFLVAVSIPLLFLAGLIEERRQTEESLWRSERIVSCSADMLVLLDKSYVYLAANEALLNAVGKTRNELIGAAMAEVFGPEIFEAIIRPRADRCLAGEEVAYENWFDFPVAGRQWVDVKYSPYVNEEGQICGFIICDRVATDRKRAELEREQLIAKLEAQNAELERFTYTVSHDLKSPLVTIQGYAGMLREDLEKEDTETVEEDLARISSAVAKMERLLNDLLDLSRIGRLVSQPEAVPLEELAREALEIVGGQIKERGVQVEILPDLPVVFGDRLRLTEVLQNLIDNAVKYMGDQPEPRIEIGSRRDGDETVCYVRDNGIGIDSRYHEKVFGLFDQLDPSAGGTGIGLSLVKRIVEVHGGRIWVESEGVGHGSTFCFTVAPNGETAEPPVV